MFLFIKTKLFPLRLIGIFIGFILIYWTPVCGFYSLGGSILEKCGFFFKNSRFSGRIRPDWGNTAWADMAGLGSIGINSNPHHMLIFRNFPCHLSQCNLLVCQEPTSQVQKPMWSCRFQGS